MLKKLSAVAFFIAILIFSLPITAHADMGPKPSVVLEFEGLEDEIYYVTLLSKNQSNGPHSFSNETINKDHYKIENDQVLGMEAWQAFRSYEDADGFYFIEFFQRCNEDNSFRWGYFPPQTFKVLIYFPQSDTYAVSGVYERYAFDSYFAVKADGLQGNMMLSAQKSYDYTWETISLVARILATIALELIIALFFGLRSKNALLFIASINIATQTILNILLNYFNYTYGGWAFVLNYIWMEILVVAIEIAVYRLYFRKTNSIKEKTVAVYALSANIVSFAAGLFIAHLIPRIF